MSKMIVSNTDQLSLVFSDPGAYLPPKHLARFVDQAIDKLDLSGILKDCNLTEKRGRSMLDPVMKTKLIIYGYCVGIISEHGIADAVREQFGFNFLSGGQYPDSTTIGKFKNRYLDEIAKLSHQVLKMAAEAGLIDLKVTALDGTKILADASRHKAMSIDRLRLRYRQLKKEIAEIRRKLKRLSSHSTSRQQELIDDLAFKTKRFETVRHAKIDWERRMNEDKEKKDKEDGQKKAKLVAERKTEKQVRKAKKKAKVTKQQNNKATKNAKSKNESKPQINFTDKESRIMKMGNGWGQCYNAQAVVDRKLQIIVAQSVTQDANDTQQWEPNLRAVGENLGLMPDNCLGDTGYFSEANLTAPTLASTTAFIPPRRQREVQAAQPVGRIPKNLSVADKMRRTLQTKEGRKLYAMRKSTVEPVFGQIKSAKQEFRQFSFRGLKKVQLEWQIVCLAHNLTKIYSSGYIFPDAGEQPALPAA